MNNIHTFRTFLSLNVSNEKNLINYLLNIKQGIRSSYPSKGIIFTSDNPSYNKENLAIFLKSEILSKANGARSN